VFVLIILDRYLPSHKSAAKKIHDLGDSESCKEPHP
jgi:hypothetical protein